MAHYNYGDSDFETSLGAKIVGHYNYGNNKN